MLNAIEQAAENALAEIRALRAALLGREADIDRLTEICDERQTVIDTLQAVCDERVALIERLSAELALARAESTAPAVVDIDWQAIAIEREAALERVSIEAERRSVLLAELTAALQERTAEIETLRRARAGTS